MLPDAANSQAQQVKLRVHRKDIPTGKAHLLYSAQQYQAGKAALAPVGFVSYHVSNLQGRSESWWSSKNTQNPKELGSSLCQPSRWMIRMLISCVCNGDFFYWIIRQNHTSEPVRSSLVSALGVSLMVSLVN